ncbi:MAG: AMP-binding protein, partial [Nitrospira sp.]
ALPGLTLSSLPAESTTAKFDLTVDLVEADGQLIGTVEYNTDLFDATTIERLIHHYVRLLEAVVADPCIRVGELQMLSPAERRQLLVEWNATVTESPHTQTIHELFEAQVAKTPEAVAVVYGDKRLTYGELDARANQLARYLRTLGVGPDAFVGLCVERSLEMLVGLLGILKAGGAYVPLDSTYPTERLAYMLADSRPHVLLTQAALRASIPATEIPTLCLDTQWELVATGATANLPHHTLPEHLAYVIYTSGSTGRPKGVAIMHRSATAFIYWASTVYGIEELQGVLASTSIHFDLSVFELFVTLSYGGQVILSENALALSTLVNANDVTLINTVPSAIKELLRQNAIPNSVRTVNLAGEPLQSAVVDQLYALGGIQRVFDLYGPSEDTTYSTYMLRRLQGP